MKEHQGTHDTNQRELNSLHLDLVKSDSAT